MTTTIYYTVISIYYIAFFLGSLVILLMLALGIIHTLNKLAKKYKFLWMIAEYNYYREDFKEFFKDKKSMTGRFNKINK